MPTLKGGVTIGTTEALTDDSPNDGGDVGVDNRRKRLNRYKSRHN